MEVNYIKEECLCSAGHRLQTNFSFSFLFLFLHKLQICALVWIKLLLLLSGIFFDWYNYWNMRLDVNIKYKVIMKRIIMDQIRLTFLHGIIFMYCFAQRLRASKFSLLSQFNDNCHNIFKNKLNTLGNNWNGYSCTA